MGSGLRHKSTQTKFGASTIIFMPCIKYLGKTKKHPNTKPTK